MQLKLSNLLILRNSKKDWKGWTGREESEVLGMGSGVNTRAYKFGMYTEKKTRLVNDKKKRTEKTNSRYRAVAWCVAFIRIKQQ